MIQWAQTKLVHMTLGNTSVLCTSLVCAHCIGSLRRFVSILVYNWNTLALVLFKSK